MKSISKLKDEARKHEQREEWEKAIQAYLQVLKIADEGEAEVELPLYNRLGDLCVRLGRPQEAMRHYEQAADRYAEAGLYNNAIALCNKALRYNPDRLELIRKLGQFSASQGFITDARRYFLDYAERQFKAGKVTDALNALEDFANVSDDPEIREMLGRQLQAHGRINDAVDELRKAHAMWLHAGDTQRSDKLRAEILAIDPRAGVDTGAAPPAPTRPHEVTEIPGLVDIETPEPETFEVASYDDAEATSIEGLETLPDADTPDFDRIEVSGFQVTGGEPVLADIDLGAGGGIEGLETTAFDFDTVDGAASLEDLGIDREETSFGASAVEDSESFPLPLLGDDDEAGLPDFEDGESSTFDLPLLGDEPGEEAAPLRRPEMDSPPPMDVGGDLRIDLNALGGAAFQLPTSEEPVEVPQWEPPAPAAELPSLEDDGLDLPTWEAETPSTFDLPSFDIPEDEPTLEPVVDHVAEDVIPPAAMRAPEEVTPEVIDVAPEPIDIPPIELPTWDTDAVSMPADTIPEVYEADWVEPLAEEDETTTELPTFSYDDEAAEEEPVVDAEDYDPLGLAAHVSPRDVPAPAPIVPVAGGLAPPEGVEDWLDDVADDVADLDDEPAPWAEVVAQPALDGPDEPDATVPRPTVEDVRAEAAGAAEAAREMPAVPPPSPTRQDGYVDLGALIAADDQEEGTRFQVQESVPTGDEDRDFAELLSQFKSKVQEHLPPEDAAAHYDLGLAFKEMGLVDEAIGEFQIAMRAGHMRLKVYEELGQCFLQKEQYNIAEKVLTRALDLKFDNELELLGVYYHLGRAYEALGRRDEARDAYERVLGLDINFEDVTDRLARL